MDTKKSAGDPSSPAACSTDDCSECWSACVEFPHPFLHTDGHPFCVKGRPVTVLKLVQSERIQPGCMKPNADRLVRRLEVCRESDHVSG